MIEHITGFKILGMRLARVNYVTMVTFVIFLILIVLFILFFEDVPKPAAITEIQDKEKGLRKSSQDSKYPADHFNRQMSEIIGM